MIRVIGNRGQEVVTIDDEISLKAKGIFAILSKFNGFNVNYINELKEHSNDGKDSIRTGIKELENHGYLVRERIREGGRFKGTLWKLYFTPDNKEGY